VACRQTAAFIQEKVIRLSAESRYTSFLPHIDTPAAPVKLAG
jgi:hypothetical protein